MSATRILLVEDDPHDLELTLRALQRAHVASPVEVARDGDEALQLLHGPDAAVIPSLVLLDLELPKRSGLDVLREMRRHDRTRATPVVVLSSTDAQPEVDECYRLGANSFVRKPVEFSAFSEAVRQIGLYWLLLNQPPRAGGRP